MLPLKWKYLKKNKSQFRPQSDPVATHHDIKKSKNLIN